MKAGRDYIPDYDESEQGVDQDLVVRKAETAQSIANQRLRGHIRLQVVDTIRNGEPTSEALSTLKRRPMRAPRRRSVRANDAVDAVIYARVSTREQARTGGGEEGYSIPYQRKASLAKASDMGVNVIDEYIDAGKSAKTADRPELQRLLKDIRKHHIRYVIVHKIDRLCRNREDDMAIRVMFAREGVELISCTEHITDSAHGRFVHNIMADTAEFYRENLAEEVKKGLYGKAREGGTPFRAPLGYLNNRDIVNGVMASTIILDEDRHELIRWALNEFSTGEWVVSDLTLAARERGLTNRPTGSRPVEPISQNTLNNMLRNPYYMGVVAYGGAFYDGKHQALISPEIWLRIQDILAAHAHAGEKDRKHPHYLRGSIFCGGCGARLVYSRNRGRGGIYEYFFCVKKKTKANNCTRRAVRLDAVEEGIERFYASFQPHPETIRALRVEVMEEFTRHQAQADKHAERARRRMAKLNDERTKLLQAHYVGAVPLDMLKPEMARLTREIAAAERDTEAALINAKTLEDTLNQALTIAADCQTRYSAAKPAVRRRINQGFFTKLYIDQDGSVERYELTEPFAQLLEGSVTPTNDAANIDVAGESSEVQEPGWKLHSLGSADHGADLLNAGVNKVDMADSVNTLANPADHASRGVKERDWVGATGFEPVTLRL